MIAQIWRDPQGAAIAFQKVQIAYFGDIHLCPRAVRSLLKEISHARHLAAFLQIPFLLDDAEIFQRCVAAA